MRCQSIKDHKITLRLSNWLLSSLRLCIDGCIIFCDGIAGKLYNISGHVMCIEVDKGIKLWRIESNVAKPIHGVYSQTRKKPIKFILVLFWQHFMRNLLRTIMYHINQRSSTMK